MVEINNPGTYPGITLGRLDHSYARNAAKSTKEVSRFVGPTQERPSNQAYVYLA